MTLPLRLAELTPAALQQGLHGAGIPIVTGPFVFSIRSYEPEVAEGLSRLYGAHLVDRSGFADFAVEVRRARGLRGLLKPQVEFLLDGHTPFHPLPRAQAFAMLEWGMNWCIASQAHQYLVIHAAVVEREGLAAILPAPPGSGKSTLTAALIHRGWRLLSDELALVELETGQMIPLARPVNLKNNSIEVLKGFAPEARWGREVPDTQKGRVVHVRVPDTSVAAATIPAQPRWVVFPRWQAGAELTLEPHAKAHAFIQLADNAFNYSMLGERGFRVLADLIDRCDSVGFTYSRLDDAIAYFDKLVDVATR
ncbi:HprK-related kinase A [Niveibacterium sp. SC-1]|uniref:HprK-related kinase A n=1 Tax=Niveibacterium sp. SC-1 TaxID=3135646 RepID=UPI00311FA334